VHSLFKEHYLSLDSFQHNFTTTKMPSMFSQNTTKCIAY